MPMTELARRYAPWSASMLTSAVTCPRQFQLGRVIHQEKASAASDNQVGSAIHAYLEHRVGARAETSKFARQRALEHYPLTSVETEHFETLFGAAEAFVRRFTAFCGREDVTKALTEQRWAVSESFGSVDFRDPSAMFRGVVDLAAVTRHGDVWILDHKSGTVRAAEDKMQQLDAYAAMAVSSVSSDTPEGVRVRGVRCGINSLANSGPQQLLWLPYRTADTVRAVQQPALIRAINEAADQLGDFPARPGKRWPCKYCGYRLTCDASLARS